MNRDTPRDLVAVNGLGALEYLWDGLRAALPPEVALRVLDLPGHGDRPPAPDYHYAALAQDVARRTDDLSPFPLVGWSVGAAVAWLFAARHPGRVTRLALVDPASPHQSRFRHGPLPPPVHTFTYASPAEVAAALRSIDPTFSEDDALRGYRPNTEGRWEPRYDPAIHSALVEDARERGEELYSELSQVRVPTLIVRGERSFLSDQQVAELAHVLPKARVLIVKAAGHFMIREKPRELARLLLEFLFG